MAGKNFVVTEKILKFWEAIHREARCRICGHIFEEGDQVTYKPTSRNKNRSTNLYCKACLEEGSTPRLDPVALNTDP